MSRAGSLRRHFLVENLDLEAASGVPGARWEAFQLALFDDEGTFRIDNKSRQIAFSFACAADGLAGAILEGRDAIFVSINQEEAAEKVRYAHRIYESLQVAGLPKILRDRMFGMELENGARVDSLPARPPRGRARANIYMDEFAHVPRDRAIYQAALPIISKGGRLRMGSSPFGAMGVFWEIFEQKIRPYPGFVRRSTPWWETYAFCRDMRRARREAPAMASAERVEVFGNSRIREIFTNIPVDDFQQEFETQFVDESTAWIAWEEIRDNQEVDLLCHLGTAAGKDIGAALDAVNALNRDVNAGRVEPSFALGMDVGRTRNATEIFLVGLGTTKQYPLRLALTLDAVGFDEQADVLRHAMKMLPVAIGYIDRTGIGMQLAEKMEREYPAKLQGRTFTAGLKLEWSTTVKMLVQQKRTPLPVDRDLAYQIHSIKRLRSAGNTLVFDTDANERHHADKYWAWALALAAAHEQLGEGAKVARAL